MSDDPQQQTITQTEPDSTVQVAPDPFSLDETKLASLSPEQRASLDPIFTEWKTKAKSEIEKSGKTWEDKYKPVEEKARALDELVKDRRFISWWQNVQTAGQQQTGVQPQMQDFASPEEWQQAASDMYAGNGEKMKQIQARMFAAMATPVVQELRKSQDELRNSQEEFRMVQEMKDLFERHPEAKELDALGRDANDPGSISHLEMWLNWADENGKTFEDGYNMAKRTWDAAVVKSKQEAMGMVQQKKESVTSGSSTSRGATGAIVEVADTDELMQKNMEYILNGQTPPRFVVRQPVKDTQRWAQKT